MTFGHPLVELHQVCKAYEHPVLTDLDLAIADGEFVTLLGPSGCGKTTILRLIAGFEAPDAGRVVIAGKDVTQVPPHRRTVNTVFQSYALFPHLSVFRNVAFGLRMQGLEAREIERRAMEALAVVRLEEFARRKPHQLSGGQQQRVALARALVNRPLLLLLDEPLSALDSKLRRQMQGELKQIQRELGISFLFVTHDQEEALSMSDRVVVMNAGHIEQSGTPREVYETPASLFVARFVGESNIFAGTVEARVEDGIVADLDGYRAHLVTQRAFDVGDAVKVVLRPEDMRLAPWTEGGSDGLKAVVEAKHYKGATLDSVLRLADGRRLLASEFFDEGREEVDHAIGEAVAVTWVPGWEVVLADG